MSERLYPVVWKSPDSYDLVIYDLRKCSSYTHLVHTHICCTLSAWLVTSSRRCGIVIGRSYLRCSCENNLTVVPCFIQSHRTVRLTIHWRFSVSKRMCIYYYYYSRLTVNTAGYRFTVVSPEAVRTSASPAVLGVLVAISLTWQR